MVIFGYHWSIHTSSDRHHRPLARGIWIPVGWPMTHVPSATDLTARGQVRRHAVSRSPVRARTTADLPGSWARMPRGDSAPPWKGLHVPHVRGATVEGGVLMSDTAHGCRRRHKPRIAGLVFMLHEHGRRCRVPFPSTSKGCRLHWQPQRHPKTPAPRLSPVQKAREAAWAHLSSLRQGP